MYTPRFGGVAVDIRYEYGYYVLLWTRLLLFLVLAGLFTVVKYTSRLSQKWK